MAPLVPKPAKKFAPKVALKSAKLGEESRTKERITASVSNVKLMQQKWRGSWSCGARDYKWFSTIISALHVFNFATPHRTSAFSIVASRAASKKCVNARL